MEYLRKTTDEVGRPWKGIRVCLELPIWAVMRRPLDESDPVRVELTGRPQRGTIVRAGNRGRVV